MNVSIFHDKRNWNVFHFRSSWVRILFIFPEILVASTVSVILENIAVLTMWFGNWYDFYIVQKELESDDNDVEADTAGAKIPLNQTIDEDLKQSMSATSQKIPKVDYEGKQNSTVNVMNEHENRKLSVIQGV